MTTSLSDQIGSHEAAKILARESIDQTLYELKDGSYTFSDDYAIHDLMRSIQIWIKGQQALSSRLSAIVMMGEFEVWASSKGFNLTKSHDGTYVYNPAYYAFLGWTEAKGVTVESTTEQMTTEPTRQSMRKSVETKTPISLNDI